MSLEYCCLTREPGNLDDVTFQERAVRSIGLKDGNPELLRTIVADAPKEPVLTPR